MISKSNVGMFINYYRRRTTEYAGGATYINIPTKNSEIFIIFSGYIIQTKEPCTYVNCLSNDCPAKVMVGSAYSGGTKSSTILKKYHQNI